MHPHQRAGRCTSRVSVNLKPCDSYITAQAPHKAMSALCNHCYLFRIVLAASGGVRHSCSAPPKHHHPTNATRRITYLGLPTDPWALLGTGVPGTEAAVPGARAPNCAAGRQPLRAQLYQLNAAQQEAALLLFLLCPSLLLVSRGPSLDLSCLHRLRALQQVPPGLRFPNKQIVSNHRQSFARGAVCAHLAACHSPG